MLYSEELHLSEEIYEYLKNQILPQITKTARNPIFKIQLLKNRNNTIWLYEDIHTKAKIIGKEIGKRSLNGTKRLTQEFNALFNARSLGFIEGHTQVVRPLGYNPSIAPILFQDYITGNNLGAIIERSFKTNNLHPLKNALKHIAYFLSQLHNKSHQDIKVDFDQECTYFYKIVDQLRHKKMSQKIAHRLYDICHEWKKKDCMWHDAQVFVHGDATPDNFIFNEQDQLIAIDFERARYSDRTFDIGRIIGEIHYAFIVSNRPIYELELLIVEFLTEYTLHFPDRNAAYKAIKQRLPFQVAITLLRIARNPWINNDHYDQLINEATTILG